MIKKNRIWLIFIIFLRIMLMVEAAAQSGQAAGSQHVEARTWSKVKGVVHYSDWKSYRALTITDLPGFRQDTTPVVTRYGSDPEKRFESTGFFHVVRDKDRWWIADPEGRAGLNVSVNSVRPGPSQRNAVALQQRFGSEEAWIDDTHRQLEARGFNGTACWSEIPLVKKSNLRCDTPLTYMLMLNLYQGFRRRTGTGNGAKEIFSVYDPAFARYVEEQVQSLSENRDDPDLFGYFSDNELAFDEQILDDYLAIGDEADPHYQVARRWMEKEVPSGQPLTDSLRQRFLGVVAGQYYMIVSEAIRRYDPNHMYLGSRLHGRPKHNRYIVEAAGRYSDILSVNYYGHWEPVSAHFDFWERWGGKPVMITEFYIKSDDSGLPNITGAGWRVRTDNDRGLFYENFCLRLLQMKNCVGWNWFRYQDNDPTGTGQDESNNDSNKGIVNNDYKYYPWLTEHMKRINKNRYRLIYYFDHQY